MANRSFAGKKFVAKVAGIGLRKNMRHFLVFAEFTRREELLVAEIAFEAGIGTTVELGSMHG